MYNKINVNDTKKKISTPGAREYNISELHKQEICSERREREEQTQSDYEKKCKDPSSS
jgi:hypothetical protein